MKVNIDEIKDYVKISDVISRYIQIKPKGTGRFVARCPFHNENTPSFSIDDGRGFFNCFGCNKGGDVITFVKEYSNLTFIEAVKEVAGIAGLTLNIPEPDANDSSTDERKKGADVLERLTKYLSEELFKSKNAAEYLLKDRCLKRSTVEFFRLGYFPMNHQVVAERFADDVDLLVKLGVFGKSENGRLFSGFTGRLIFPIMNTSGSVIAFSGRVLPSSLKGMTPERAKTTPKYYNSPESYLFKKREVLYNYNNVKRLRKEIVVVEGYMDVISLHQAGVKSAVAQMGTAFANSHMAKIWTISKNPIFFLDLDEAGKRASMRVWEMVLKMLKPDYSVRFVCENNKNGDTDGALSFKDPDELVLGLSKVSPDKVAGFIDEFAVELHEKIWLDCSDNLEFSNPNLVSSLEARLKGLCDTVENKEVAKNYWNFFKNKLFDSGVASRKAKKFGKNEGGWRGSEVPDNAKLKDIIKGRSVHKNPDSALDRVEEIFALFVFTNPSVMKMDCWYDSYVEIENVKIANALKSFERDGKLDDSVFSLVKNRHSNMDLTFADMSSVEGFYMKLYDKKIACRLKREMLEAASMKDSNRVKALGLELRKYTNIANDFD